MTATVGDVIAVVEGVAPPFLAEDWDNVGLQVGSRKWPAKTVWTALDPSPEVVTAACEAGVDMLVTHHPLIFKPLASVNPDDSTGRLVDAALKHRLAVYAAHTNLDSVHGGVNDMLCDLIGVHHRRVLADSRGAERFKLVVFVPAGHEDRLLSVLFNSAAGRIGDYACCTFSLTGKGTFRPGPEARPLLGRTGEITQADEIRIEAIIAAKDLAPVVENLRSVHPYDTMAYDVYPLLPAESIQGLGRVGRLEAPLNLEALAGRIKRAMKLGHLRVTGPADLKVKRVAVCSGSGGSLMARFLTSGAQVLVSGDLRYHDARTAQAEGVGLIDIGHFASEHPVVALLAERLDKELAEAGFQVQVTACNIEGEPFRIV